VDPSRHRRLEPPLGQWGAAQAQAGRVEDCVRECCGDRTDRAFARTRRGQFREVDQHDVDSFGRLDDVEDRV